MRSAFVAYGIEQVQFEREGYATEGPFHANIIGHGMRLHSRFSLSDKLTVAQLKAETRLLDKVLDYIASVEAEWTNHDGTVSAAQQAVIDRYAAQREAERAEREAAIAAQSV
jgi:hypothetical protein